MSGKPNWKRSFVDWSESDMGFYIDQYWNPAIRDWVEGDWRPIIWHDRQRRVLEHLFTLTERGKLPYSRVYWIDIGKSAKSLLQAAVAQWLGMFHTRGSDVLLAANSEKQAGVRCYKALQNSLNKNPYRDQFVNNLKEETTFLDTENVVRAIPLKASTQSGSNAVFIGFDESWDYEGEAADDFVAEVKPSPTKRISILMHTSYPPHVESEGVLGRVLDSFMDATEQPREGIHKVEGLEDLPLWVNNQGAALWWNHEPYDWHLKVEESGLTFLEEQRLDTATTQSSHLRIWEARRSSRTDEGIPIDEWDACVDDEWQALDPTARGEVMCAGLDIGDRKTSALVFTGFDPVTLRYPLLKHLILTVGDHVNDEAELFETLMQTVLDMHRNHYLVAVYFDPNQAAKMAADLTGEGVNMVRWTQNTRRYESDKHYRTLILTHKLRLYRRSYDLRKHVLNSVWRETRLGIRMDKAATNKDYDGAVAHSGACLAVTENLEQMKKLQRRRRYRSSLATSVRPINPYAALYGGRK